MLTREVLFTMERNLIVSHYLAGTFQSTISLQKQQIRLEGHDTFLLKLELRGEKKNGKDVQMKVIGKRRQVKIVRRVYLIFITGINRERNRCFPPSYKLETLYGTTASILKLQRTRNKSCRGDFVPWE